MTAKTANANVIRFLTSSIVKKQVMGFTGLLLCGFLTTHVLRNILICVGPDAFNTYAYKLTSTPLIYVAEAILGLIFLTHLGLATRLTIENHLARPQGYYMKRKTGRGATFASSTMPFTGIILLLFLVWHIVNLKFGPVYTTYVSDTEMRDLYRLVMEYFSNITNVIGYIVAMFAMAIHLMHGFWSAFQSLGLSHPKYNCKIKCGGYLLAFSLAIGFSALPIYCYLQGGK